MPTRGIDFTRLSLRDALDLAVLIEEEARERYEEFAAQLELHHTDAAARFFRFMADNEEKHRRALAERRERLFGTQPTTVGRDMLFDVEAPEYDEVRASMTPREALLAARRCEEKAFRFFDQALPHLVDIEVHALFDELRREEVGHQEMIDRELARRPEDDGFDPADFEDEPVAHD